MTETTIPTLEQWFVNVSTWNTQSKTYKRASRLLPAVDQQKLQRYIFEKDQKLALASRLLQRAAIQNAFGLSFVFIDIKRTPENKPYWSRPVAYDTSLWNYNVSHHGSIVAIASHPNALVGIDVVKLSDRPHCREGEDKLSMENRFFQSFQRHFTEEEWEYIQTRTNRLEGFYQLWSLKESYIKAIGIGLGFQLQRLSFSIVNETGGNRKWQVHIDNVLNPQWTFYEKYLEIEKETYFIATALGPFTDMWHPETSAVVPYPLCCRKDIVKSPTNAVVWQEKSIEDLLK